MIDRKYEVDFVKRELEGERMKLKFVRSAKVGALIKKVNKIAEFCGGASWMYAGIRYPDGEPKPYVALRVDVSGLDSFSDERLVKAIIALEKIVPFVASKDLPEWSERDYISSELDADEIRIKLEAKLSDSPSGCKRVVVGEKRVPEKVEPIYELVCEGEEVAA